MHLLLIHLLLVQFNCSILCLCMTSKKIFVNNNIIFLSQSVLYASCTSGQDQSRIIITKMKLLLLLIMMVMMPLDRSIWIFGDVIVKRSTLKLNQN